MRGAINKRMEDAGEVAAGLRQGMAEDRRKLKELEEAEKEEKKRKREGMMVAAAAAVAAVTGAKRQRTASLPPADSYYGGAGGEGGGDDDASPAPAEPSWELPEELREYVGDPDDRKAMVVFKQQQSAARQRIERARAKWQREQAARSKESEARRKADGENERRVARERKEAEESLAARQEAYEKEMEKHVIRRMPVGLDRYHRRYWCAKLRVPLRNH